LIEKSNLEQASAIHVTSIVELEELGKFALQLPRVVMVPNGVDEADRASAGDPSEDIRALAREQPLILFFGRIAWVKGLDRLLRGFARSRAGTLAIVGTDYESLAPRLSQLAGELGIGERVRFVPRTVTVVDKEFDRITPLIITSNKAPNIGRSLDKLVWARRIVVIDSGNTDEALDLLRSYRR
jgi:glycosyltransferase involved in cell wall biosynthesis